MAEKRFVNTSIWRDEYVRGLNHEEFRLYIYLHTNESITYYGVLELNPLKMTIECNLDTETVQEILKKFEKDDRIFVKELQVFVCDFIKTIWPNGPNPVTLEKLKSDAYRLYPEIHEAVLEEFAAIEKKTRKIKLK